MKPGDWRCAACSEHNFASRSECFRCGEPKYALPYPLLLWLLHIHFALNASVLTVKTFLSTSSVHLFAGQLAQRLAAVRAPGPSASALMGARAEMATAAAAETATVVGAIHHTVVAAVAGAERPVVAGEVVPTIGVATAAGVTLMAALDPMGQAVGPPALIAGCHR